MNCKPLPWSPQTSLQVLVASTKTRHRAATTKTRAMSVNLFGQNSEEKQEGITHNAQDKRRQDDIALVAQLKACATQKDLYTGSRLHAAILNKGLLKSNIFIGNTLIDMYVKCGALVMAQQVFDELPVQSVISWNALMAGYVLNGDCEKALNYFERMQCEGLFCDMVTFSTMLKACCTIGALEKGKRIHTEIITTKLLVHSTKLGNSLVDMYAKCGAFAQAHQVFDSLPAHDIVSWNALIAGYCKHNHGPEAFGCFERMKHAGLTPDAVTFSCIIRACGSTGAGEKLEEIHAEIVTKGLLENNIKLGSALLDTYARSGALAKAQKLLDELPVRDAVAWTALIVGYCQHGHAEEALDCFELMKLEGLSPDAVTFACILKACGSIQEADKGKKVHAEIVRKGSVGYDIAIGNALVDMYAKCSALMKAKQIFEELCSKDVVSWSILISEYCRHGHAELALECFQFMKCEGLSPDAVTLAGILKACGSIGAVEMGKEIHDVITERGLLHDDFVLGSALVDMYAKCGVLEKAQQVVDGLPVRSVVSWNALITGYCHHNRFGEVLQCFEKMKDESILPDAVTFTCVLKACGSIGSAEMGKDIHAEVVLSGLLKDNTVLGSALVEMYAKCGALAKAEEVFGELQFHDVVVWTGLITGYCQHGLGEEALDCFEQMVDEGFSPDAVTFVCILKACGSIGAVEKGCDIHAEMARMKLLETNNVLRSALVDMYAKCGVLRKAQEVFDELCVRDVVAWSALITGYSEHGHGQEALKCFERMILDGALPDAVIFACVLKAYVSMGASEEGFTNLISTYESRGTPKDNTCMIDVFAGARSFDKAVSIIMKMPTSDHLPAWFALLNAYQKIGNNDHIGKFAF